MILRDMWTNRLLTAAFVVLAVGACGSANGTGDTPSEDTSRPSTATDSRSTAGPQEGPGRGMAWVILGTDTVHAEVAATAEERRQGLMNREDLPDGTGMLFVFPDEAPRSFWMSNTFIPLDIGFISAGNRIVSIKQMEPEDTNLTDSDAAAMYALEVPQGWFEAHGVAVGHQAEILFGPR